MGLFQEIATVRTSRHAGTDWVPARFAPIQRRSRIVPSVERRIYQLHVPIHDIRQLFSDAMASGIRTSRKHLNRKTRDLMNCIEVMILKPYSEATGTDAHCPDRSPGAMGSGDSGAALATDKDSVESVEPRFITQLMDPNELLAIRF
jgi:hypothetical protein